ncbi:MAG TPA: type I-C CRISPR-associated protein Cas8c/Csd1, partial [Thermotogota bacterium]|nr:type I-C CRISPR-associated protein Cas8c/Csd1 [Thermotogota bacterium]
MSWIQQLDKTYDNCRNAIGVIYSDSDVPLLPICHTTVMAHITVLLDQNGELIKAQFVPKDNARTIIPCTESSAGRTSGEAAHPLADKLQYVSGDYSSFVNGKGSYFTSYKKQLEEWCNSENSHRKARTILTYVSKCTLIRDLIDKGIMQTINGVLTEKWDKKRFVEAPKNVKPMDAVIRWAVEIPGDPVTETWKDTSLFDSWIKYYLSLKNEKGLCYASGTDTIIATQHSSKIRSDADKAKMISSNDTSGFTFRGRFTNDKQACEIGYEVTQKAHNALRWLIAKQGYKQKDLTYLAWATTMKAIPDPFADSESLFWAGVPDSLDHPYTGEEFANRLTQKMKGFKANLDDGDNIIILGLNSASPGRLSLLFYQENRPEEFLEKIEYWHSSCCWIHRFKKKESINEKTGKKESKQITFVGAPAPHDIVEAAYGKKVDDKLRKACIKRIVPCIINKASLPKDIVLSTFRRACNGAALETWEWQKTLSIACALFRKYMYLEEVYEMALEEKRKSRD